MSERWPGGIINKTAPVPTGPYATGTAPGVWTLDQQAYWQQQGLWPTAGLFPNYIEDVFSTYLYTGTGSAQTIANGIDLTGKGGLTWIKGRTTGDLGNTNNILFDTVRGVGKYLFTDSTSAQGTASNSLTAFNTNGFSLGTDTTLGDVNYDSTVNYASWTFRKQPKFFDVVTWTGDGTTNRQIPHNLGVQPGALLYKRTDGTGNWMFQHRSITDPTSYLMMNNTNAVSAGGGLTNFSNATSTYFLGSGGSSAYQANVTGQTYVAYLFASNAGGFGTAGTDNVISCGGYTGTGSSNISINLGYEPQYILIKNSSSSSSYWYVQDVMRGMSYTSSNILYPNTSDSESVAASSIFIPTATGFDTSSSSGFNASGNNYIYMAIRRPMKVPTDATTVFKPVLDASAAGTKITTGFTVDTQFITNVDNTAYINTTVVDRLRGVSTNTTGKSTYLVTSHTDAEQNGSSQQTLFWDNTGYQHSAYFDSVNTGYLNFARRPGFFDEVCYDGTGATATTQTHNLGSTPEFMIIKSRSTASTSWVCYHKGVNGGVNPQNYYMLLQSNQAQTALTAMFNDTAPTSSVFTVGPQGSVGASGRTYVAYLFATCPGVSKVGSYTGNGTTQAINCGFTGGARFVLIKRTDSTSDWYVWDTARGMVSGTDPSLSLNTTAAEVNANSVYTATTGFSLLASPSADVNTSGASYIFLAIA